jgi:hypothetical protein
MILAGKGHLQPLLFGIGRVPEPFTTLLLACELRGLAAMRRKVKKQIPLDLRSAKAGSNWLWTFCFDVSIGNHQLSDYFATEAL